MLQDSVARLDLRLGSDWVFTQEEAAYTQFIKFSKGWGVASGALLVMDKLYTHSHTHNSCTVSSVWFCTGSTPILSFAVFLFHLWLCANNCMCTVPPPSLLCSLHLFQNADFSFTSTTKPNAIIIPPKMTLNFIKVRGKFSGFNFLQVHRLRGKTTGFSTYFLNLPLK